MFEKVDSQVDFVAIEHQMLAFWEENGTFEALRKKNAGKPKWSFLDGPLTANNPMGVHHAWGRTYKDCYQRFFAMKGHELRYQNGFDCQGLWVEVEVEKDLGFRTKRDIEAYGIDKFVEKCKERVRRFAAKQTDQSIRLGYWMDWDNSYYTMSDENNYTIWAFLKKCHQRGFLYQGRDSMPWCARCGTGISQHEMHEGYEEVTEDSVVLRLPLVGREKEYLLVWTTTPWTLPANVACAVGPDMKYVKVRQGDAVYYLAESRLVEMEAGGAYEVLKTIRGAEMDGWSYTGPFDELPAAGPAVTAHRVVLWSLVTSGEGTGIVHIAPGCGKEDYDLSQALGMPVLAPIDESGIYVDGYGFLEGRSAHEVKEAVFQSLREKGYLYKTEPYAHSYPHCWRCKQPLLFRNVEEWYIGMSWRDEIKEIVKQIRWIPEWGLERELDWLTNMRDWMISKKRYWGLALPIYRCQCGWFDVIGSKDELRRRAAEGWDDFEGHTPHRPWIDAVKIRCEQCGRTVSRIPDVGNPWLDAGIVPYSTVRYLEDRDYWSQWVPADLVCECFPGQFRNWFYSLLAMSTMMEGIRPFKSLLGHALVRDEHGDEMHKSAGNAIWFDDAAERMGSDVMRWLFCRHNPVQNLNFGWTIGDETRRKVFNTWWNVYAFFSNYARLDGFDPSAPPVPYAQRPDIDRWLLSDLQILVRTANERTADFDVAAMVRRAERFIDDLSNWYVRRNRRRFWRAKSRSDVDKLAAYQTLHEALVVLCRVLAPVVPFVTERMYRNLVGGVDPAAPPSVHLTEFPEPNEALIDEETSRAMGVVTAAVSAALGLRKAAKIRVRQPLGELIVVTPDPDYAAALGRFEDHVLEEINVKVISVRQSVEDLEQYRLVPNMGLLGPKYRGDAPKVAAALAELDARTVAEALDQDGGVAVQLNGSQFQLDKEDLMVVREMPANLVAGQAGEATLILDTQITPELHAEGLARDTVRHVQRLRKETGLEIEDRIHLRCASGDETLVEALSAWRDYIMAETLSVSLDVTEKAERQDAHRVKLGAAELDLEIEKAPSTR